MLTNTDITIYHREYDSKLRMDQWKRIYVPKAWWHKDEKSSVTTDGLKQADVITIRIPDTTIEVAKDDYIARGNCPVKMQTIKDLSGREFAKVTSVNRNLFGGNPHIKVVGV